MNVLILGGAGMLGPHVARALAPHHTLRITDITRPEGDLPGEFVPVDIASPAQVIDAAAGMDAIVNLSVLRNDRQLAFDVNTQGPLSSPMRCVAFLGMHRLKVSEYLRKIG